MKLPYTFRQTDLKETYEYVQRGLFTNTSRWFVEEEVPIPIL